MAKKLTKAAFLDKIRGGWTGKCAGGILGAPIEGYKRFNTIEITDELFATNFANDDLDLQLLWLDMVEQKGAHIRGGDFREHWKNHVHFPWNEYGIATRNIRLGLDHPATGQVDNTYWGESMGSPIRSEIWGMLCAGQPEMAACYARMDSQLDHYGFSVAAEAYFSACAAIAFFESDIPSILNLAKASLKELEDALCLQLIDDILNWYPQLGFATTAAKIKSLYGDADFTSAPMNVGFTILALLESAGTVAGIETALHLGHDSDCIVATAGALLGIIIGYENLPQKWKDRVGEEILLSPEVKGINAPATISELSQRTIEAASFFYAGDQYAHQLQIERSQKPSPDCFPAVRLDWEPAEPTHLWLRIEERSGKEQQLSWELTSPYFETRQGSFDLTSGDMPSVKIPLKKKESSSRPTGANYPYSLMLRNSLGEEKILERGLPYYGDWLLLGPFIQDAPKLEPMDANYPDHGMSSLPSVAYMNHDQARPKAPFIDPQQIRHLLLGGADHLPFGVQVVEPQAMTIDLGDYFYGRGERSLFLYTEITALESVSKWLCLGH
ncbi:MAG: ADP-ribosylglycohydrolase family protein, partial [Bacteroidota bacterium]